MNKNSKQQCKSQYKINGLEATDEKITGRGGLSLFVRYLEKTGIMAKDAAPNVRRLAEKQ